MPNSTRSLLCDSGIQLPPSRGVIPVLGTTVARVLVVTYQSMRLRDRQPWVNARTAKLISSPRKYKYGS